MKKQVFHPQPSAFSQVVRIGNTVHVSGQTALDSTGEIVGRNDIRAQTLKAFQNLEAMLREAGATLEDVVKLNIYATRFEDYSTIREVRKMFFPKDPPAATGLIVSSLVFRDLLVEVDAEAVVNV